MGEEGHGVASMPYGTRARDRFAWLLPGIIGHRAADNMTTPPPSLSKAHAK